MHTRTYQKLHDYLLGNLANIEEGAAKKPDSHKSQYRFKKIKEIENFFFEEKSPLIWGEDNPIEFHKILNTYKSEHLLNIMPNMKALSGKKIDPLAASEFPEEKAVEAKFAAFENQYALIPQKDKAQALTQFKTYFKITKFIADLIEINNTANDDAAYTHAYKILVLFGDKSTPNKLFNSLDTFLASHNFHEKSAPLHDALIYALPTTESKEAHIDLAKWREIIKKNGIKACRIFGKAYEIQAKLGGRAPKDFHEALETAKSIAYKRSEEDPELAELCMNYDINEKIFNQCLEIKKSRKTSDKLPQVSVDGKEVGKTGYHLVKLPIDDPRAFILGHLTDCCQSIGGHSETCVIDGITRENNGFYVLLKDKRKIVAADKKEEAKEAKESKSTPPLIQDKDGKTHIDYAHYDIVGQGYVKLFWKFSV